MANISLTLYINAFFGSILKSPIQMGSLSVNNSVTNISRLGTFKNLFLTALVRKSAKFHDKSAKREFENSYNFVSTVLKVFFLIKTVPLVSLCSTCQREKVQAVVNPQLIPMHKHYNTLCGRLLLYPSLTELPSIETK